MLIFLFKKIIKRIKKKKFNTFSLKNILNQNKIYNSKNLQEVFDNIYDMNYWNSKESRSGPGSEIKNTINISSNLRKLINNHNISSINDLGCGDMNWLYSILKDLGIKYNGYDISKKLIQTNIDKYSNNKIKFFHGDITKIQFSNSDLIFCRDCLFHLSYENIGKFFDNIKDIKFRFILITTHFDNNQKIINKDIKDGFFRPFDLFSYPFNFSKKKVIYEIIENKVNLNKKMILFKKADIPFFLLKKNLQNEKL